MSIKILPQIVKADVTDDLTGKTETREFDSVEAANKSVTEFKIVVNGKTHKFNIASETAETLTESLATLATDSTADDASRNDARRNLGSLFPRNLTGANGASKGGTDKAGMTRSAWLQANSDYKGVAVVSKENKAKWAAHLASETAETAPSTNGSAAK